MKFEEKEFALFALIFIIGAMVFVRWICSATLNEIIQLALFYLICLLVELLFHRWSKEINGVGFVE